MTSHDLVIHSGLVLEDSNETLSLGQICTLCSASEQRIIELVNEGVIEMQVAHTSGEQRFGGDALRRARLALNLQRDLGINTAGAALVVDLLERIETLERQRNR